MRKRHAYFLRPIRERGKSVIGTGRQSLTANWLGIASDGTVLPALVLIRGHTQQGIEGCSHGTRSFTQSESSQFQPTADPRVPALDRACHFDTLRNLLAGTDGL